MEKTSYAHLEMLDFKKGFKSEKEGKIEILRLTSDSHIHVNSPSIPEVKDILFWLPM